MYQTSAAVAVKILSLCRTWRVWLQDNDSGEVFMGETISTAESDQTSTSLTDDIEIGAVTCATWTVSMRKSTGNFIGKKFTLSFYLKDLAADFAVWGDLALFTCSELDGMTIDQISRLSEVYGELIPMGVFTCIRAPRTGDGRTLTLVDEVYFFDVPYVRPTSLTLPQPASVIERDVCRQLGIECAAAYSESYLLTASDGGLLFTSNYTNTLATASYDFMIDHITSGTTCRQLLGYIAGARGEFGCIDRFGRYTRRWYGTPVALIDADHADEPTVSEQANEIVGIRCKVGNTVLEHGSMTGGRVLEFENPYVTAQLLTTIFNRVRRLTWYTCELYHRLGDPRLDTGDMVTVESEGRQLNIPVTWLSFSFDGGLAANVRAAGLNETEQKANL